MSAGMRRSAAGAGRGAGLASPALTLRAEERDLVCLWVSRESRANFGAGNTSAEASTTALALLFPGVILAPCVWRGSFEPGEESLFFLAPLTLLLVGPRAPGSQSLPGLGKQ